MMDRLKNTAQFYVKLDLALLAGFGTLFTVLKIEPTQIAESIQNLQPAIWFVLVLLCFGMVLERWVVLDAESIEQNTKDMKLARRLFQLQTAAHVLFFCGVVAFTLGYTKADVDIKAQLSTYDSARTLIGSYVDRHHRVPRSIEDVEGITVLRRDTAFSYNYIDSLDYEIVLPGMDGVLGTADDWKRPVTVAIKKDTVVIGRK